MRRMAVTSIVGLCMATGGGNDAKATTYHDAYSYAIAPFSEILLGLGRNGLAPLVSRNICKP